MTAVGWLSSCRSSLTQVQAGDAGKDALAHTTHLLRVIAQDRRDATLDELQELRGRISLARRALVRAS